MEDTYSRVSLTYYTHCIVASPLRQNIKKKQQPPQKRQEKQFTSNVVPCSSIFTVSHGCLFLYPASKDWMTGQEVNLVPTDMPYFFNFLGFLINQAFINLILICLLAEIFCFC